MMKSLLTLHLSALRSVSQHCSIGVVMDVSYIQKRWEDEGDSFLTITLPRFAKTLERAVESGVWPAHEPLGFKRHKGLPTFMSGFLSRVFRQDGSLLDDPDVECIWAVRQVCYLSHKVERDCTPERVSAAFSQFIRTDDELIGLPGRIDRGRLEKFQATSNRLFGDLFQKLDARIAAYELIPKHGPGAVAESLSSLEKRDFRYWPERLESVFPYWRYTRNSVYPASYPVLVPVDQEIPVRVISVPKTQSTPRIIAIEPSSVQYAQQGLKREIYEEIDSGPLSKVLGFQDQERNQLLAQKASVDGSLATLDLSEASDRVHWFLVRTMLERYPHLWDFVWATRSHRATLPGGVTIPLQKFASMGSALTFPIEAMVFTTLSLCGIEASRSRRLKVRELPGLLSVYGDDIVVPVDSVDLVVDWLEHFGAKVNRAKSFWSGRFRESCGAEYYAGTDVSVVRLRHELPSSRDDAAEIAALVDFRNRCYRAGLWVMVGELDEELETLIRLPISRASLEDHDQSKERFAKAGISYLNRDTFLPVTVKYVRYNPEYQRLERRVPVLAARARSYRVDDEPGLLEWFQTVLRRGDFVNRYDGQERPTSFSIKRRWVEIQADLYSR
jgi:hypothetical protein